MNALVQRQRRSFLLLLLLCLTTVAQAQVKAAFSATPVAGCSPLVVYFSDSSTGDPTQWRWDLGNGATSQLRNPSATYFNPGTYAVKLVVRNAAGADSVVKAQFVTVHAGPEVDFSESKTTGCFPLTIKFTDKSTAGSGTKASWQWDFGDGTISTEANPSHTYTTAGNFTVTLRVTNAMSCVASFSKPQVIRITGGVKAAFTATDPGVCPAPSAAQFTNNSTGPAPLQYLWDFGDGKTSTLPNPVHTYTTNGSYTVRLIAKSQQGCTDTLVKESLFNIGAAKASFTHPAVLCANTAVAFTSTSTPAPASVRWEFSDSSFSTALTAVKTFSKAGLYTVRLISHFGACSDTLEKQVSVAEKPVADFTATEQKFCDLPVPVQFTPTNSGTGYSYAWDFGDNTTSTSASPLHHYTQEGLYTVRLIVTNAAGCTDTVVKQAFIHIQKPRIAISGLPKNGCLPLTITPEATLTGRSITAWQWNFGDGSTSTLARPTYTYTTAGTFDVTLVVTTSDGCTDTLVMAKAIRTGEKPKAAFTSQPMTVCPFEKVYFTDQSTGNIDKWFWDFGDGGTSTLQHPFHQFSDTGWQKVTLVVYSNTCPDTLVIDQMVYVNPPVSIFSVENDCVNRYSKQFSDKSMGPKTWLWEFGDGATSTEQSPLHTYADTGTYQVKLTVTNGSCTHFSIRSVTVLDEKADFTTPDTILCRNGIANFTAKGINSKNIATWHWDFGAGTSSRDAAKASHRYTKAGSYTVTLTITDNLGCKSTKSIQLKVFGPTAAFKTAVTAACLKDNEISFQDNSTPDGQHALVKWIWSYGDGRHDSASVAPFRYRYDSAGTFDVRLTVVDEYGCRDSQTQPAALTIAQPEAAFLVSDTASCTGRRIVFTNASKGASPAYAWSFGDGGASVVTNPAYSYQATGLYTVKLVVTDKYGCKDSVTKTDLISISLPKAAFSVSDSVGTCPPLLVHFTNLSTNYKRIHWDFGDGSQSALDTPSHFYSRPGTFQAILVVTGPGGCTDTARKTIVVKGPTGTFSYEPLTGCKPLTVHFKASTKNSVAFIWDFSDGATVATKDSLISHTYMAAGDFVPKIILTDPSGCTVPIEGKDTVRVKGVTPDFVLDKAAFCAEGTVQFNNRTVSNDYIRSYQWQFGDGSTSNSASPTYHYSTPGIYTVSLRVVTQSGCTESKTLTDTVKVWENPVVQITGDTAACAPALFTFSGKVEKGNPSQLGWQWNLANGQTANVQQPAAQTYSTDGAYSITAIATDDHGCRDTAVHLATVHPLPKTNAGEDLAICRGSAGQLNATGATTYRWQPVPSLSCTDCDSPLAAPADATQYRVTGYNRFGCSTTDSVTVTVHQPFTLQVEKGDTICTGKTILLAASGADHYSWTPALNVKNPTTGTTTATPAISTLYTVVAKDKVGCFTDTATVFIKVWPIPAIKTETVKTLSVGNTLSLSPTYSADVTSYQWSNAQTLSCATCPSPVARPKAETKYTVEVKNDGGCTAKETITVHVICNDGNLFIPNTFSPNTDGRNDRFYPRGTGISSIKLLKVYNRWGELVFSRENFNANDAGAGWDGLYKGQAQPSEVYVYTCDVVCMNNEVLTFKGDITLLR